MRELLRTKNVMPSFESQANAEADKLPTLSQWAKVVSKDALLPTRLVKIIWTPNQYNSYSLDTEAYRLRVAESHGLYQVLKDYLEDWIHEGAVLSLSITPGKTLKVTLSTLDNEECSWEPLGEMGYKMQELKRVKKTVSAKTQKGAKSEKPSELPPTGPVYGLDDAPDTIT